MESTDTRPRREQKSIQVIKQVIGAPIPILLSLYIVSLLTSMSGMETFGWATSVLTLLYIIVDRFSANREFQFYWLGPDIALILLVIVVAIGLLTNPVDPSTDFYDELGSLRWIPLLYLLSYTMSLYPSLNRSFRIYIALGGIVAAYAIFQHFTGIDFRQEWGLRAESAVTPAPFKDATVFQSAGLFSHHLTYGYAFVMVLCFPFSALLLSNRRSYGLKWVMGFLSLIIGLSLIWTYGRGVWISMVAALLLMTGFVSKRYLVVIALLLATTGGIYYQVSEGFQERFKSIWANNYMSNDDRRELWRANIQMFQDNPWFGVGFGRNEFRTPEYYQKMGIQNNFAGHAHNVYFQWLSTTGFLGFGFYMIFILSFLLTSLRLWNEIPRTHYWHRVFILGAIGAQVAMHTGGLTQWNFGDAEVNHLFIFILALVGYLSREYTENIVPDDYAL